MNRRGNGFGGFIAWFVFVAVVDAALVGVLIWVGIEIAQWIGRH